MIDKNKIRLKIYLATTAVLLTVSIAGFMLVEKMSLTDAIYFSIVTMATVGYGDIAPQTGIGKILSLITIIGGVGTFLGVISSLTDLFVNRREESLREQKIDMVTGLFFSEMGNDLLKRFVLLDPEAEKIHSLLNLSEEWTGKDYDKAFTALSRHRLVIESRNSDIHTILECLQNRADVLLRLIENPAIQDHEHFSELLLAVFHLRDELLHRSDLLTLTDSDRKHLENDILRVYKLLIFEWLRYISYLKKNYEYLFSLAMRLNPFDPDADAAVTNS